MRIAAVFACDVALGASVALTLAALEARSFGWVSVGGFGVVAAGGLLWHAIMPPRE